MYPSFHCDENFFSQPQINVSIPQILKDSVSTKLLPSANVLQSRLTFLNIKVTFALFNMLQKMILTLSSLNKTLACNHSMENYQAIIKFDLETFWKEQLSH